MGGPVLVCYLTGDARALKIRTDGSEVEQL